VEGLFRKLSVRRIENGFAGLQEAVKSGHVFRREFRDFSPGPFNIGMGFKH
jgi:hypothetical protein